MKMPAAVLPASALAVAGILWLRHGWVDFHPLCYDGERQHIEGAPVEGYALRLQSNWLDTMRFHPRTGQLQARAFVTVFNADGLWTTSTKAWEIWRLRDVRAPPWGASCEVIRDLGMHPGARLRPGWGAFHDVLPRAWSRRLYQLFRGPPPRARIRLPPAAVTDGREENGASP